MKVINVKGTIVSNEDKWIYEWFGYDAVSPEDVEKGLQDAGDEDVTIVINSGGGDVMAANDIAYALSQHKGNVSADLSGFCASAATIVACGAKKVRAYPSVMYMIHNVSSGASGDYHAMDKQSAVLKTANKAISKLYQQKTGKSEKELLSLMDKETWFTAEEAKENSFIDEIIGETGIDVPFTINNSFANIISDDVKQKIRTLVNGQPDENDKAFFIAQEQLKLLKMKVR